MIKYRNKIIYFIHLRANILDKGKNASLLNSAKLRHGRIALVGKEGNENLNFNHISLTYLFYFWESDGVSTTSPLQKEPVNRFGILCWMSMWTTNALTE